MSEKDYGAIEAAVMETARGRWFLLEYARRNRNSDTGAVLDAISRLERAMETERSAGDADRIRFDLIDMAGAIARTKAEIAAIRLEGEEGHIGGATNELDAIVKSTETATGEILAAAEHLQEVAWTLREAGVDGAVCDVIDQRATDIYTACSFQDITGQRTQKVIEVLRYLEGRLAAMMSIWGGARDMPAQAVAPREDGLLLNGPALPSGGLMQSAVDAMLEVGDGQAGDALSLSPPFAAEGGADLAPLAIDEPTSSVAPSPAPAMEDDGPPPLRPSLEEGDSEAEAPALPAASALSSPFSAVTRPRPRARADDAAPDEALSRRDGEIAAAKPDTRARSVTLAEIEALSFEEKAALFS